jgi:hypothetical protein
MGGFAGGRPKDETKLSTKPRQIRNRLRRSAQKQNKPYEADLKLLAKYDPHHKALEDWDLEELARGKPKDKNGNFTGPSPKWITPAVAKEAKRRLLDLTVGQLAGHVDQAIKTMANLMVCEDTDENGKPIVDSKTKFAAAAFIIEHTIGRPKAIIELSETEDRVARSIASAIILDDGRPQGHHEVIEGELADQEEDDDEA